MLIQKCQVLLLKMQELYESFTINMLKNLKLNSFFSFISISTCFFNF